MSIALPNVAHAEIADTIYLLTICADKVSRDDNGRILEIGEGKFVINDAELDLNSAPWFSPI